MLSLLLELIDTIVHLVAILLGVMYKLLRFIVSLIFPLFYNEIQKQYDSIQQPAKRQYYQLFVCLLFLTEAIRCSAFAGALYDNNTYYVKHFELFLAFMNRNNSVDFNVYICFAMLFLYLAYMNYLLYLSPQCKNNWALLYDLLVLNTIQFWSQFKDKIRRELFNIETFKSLRYQKAISKVIKDLIVLIYELWSVGDDDPKWLFNKKLQYFSFLTTRCRIRSIILLAVGEFIASAAIFVIGFVYGIILLLYIYLIVTTNLLVRSILIILDLLIVGGLVFCIARMLLPTLMAQLIISLTLGKYLREQNTQIREHIAKLIQNRSLYAERFIFAIKRFHRQHSSIVQFLYQYNRFLSYLALSFSVFNLPINAYLCANLYYKNTLIDDNNIPIFAIFAIQLSVSLIYAASIIRMSSSVHLCSKTLTPVQLHIWKGHFRFKLKIMLKYELVNCSHHKVTVNNGPFGEVTQRYMGSILKDYFELFLYSINLLNNRKMF